MEKKNAMVVFGGKTFEHDISIITTLLIYNRARIDSKYNLLPVYIDKNEEWFLFCGEELKVELFKNFTESLKKNQFKKIYMKLGDNSIYYKHRFKEKKIVIDAVLNCCHGGKGEDGSYVNLFENLNLPITSGSSVSLAISMDKILSKLIFKGMKLPVIDYVYFSKQDYLTNKNKLIDKIDKLGYPVILKPASLGSSIGIDIVKSFDKLDESIDIAFEFDNQILIEKAILENMKEYNIACMKNGEEIIVSKIDSPIRKDEILSFKDKYVGEGDKFNGEKANSKGAYFALGKKKFPEVEEKIQNKIKEIATYIYKNLNFSGVIRIDFILDKKNKIYVNEINTVPGSLGYYFFVPNHFKTIGKFVDCLLDNSIYIFNNNKKIKKEFITKLF